MGDELGKKMICQECGTRFFDLKRSKLHCPRCSGSQVILLDQANSRARFQETYEPEVDLELEDESPPEPGEDDLDELEEEADEEDTEEDDQIYKEEKELEDEFEDEL